MTDRYFLVWSVFKKVVALFVNIDKQKNQKRYTSWFLKYLQTAFLKTTQPLQCDPVPWQNEAIAN